MNRLTRCEGYNARDAGKFYQMGEGRSMTPAVCGDINIRQAGFRYPLERMIKAVKPIIRRSCKENTRTGIFFERWSANRTLGGVPVNSNSGPANQLNKAPPIKPPRCPQLSIPGESPIRKLITATWMIWRRALRDRFPNNSLCW